MGIISIDGRDIEIDDDAKISISNGKVKIDWKTIREELKGTTIHIKGNVGSLNIDKVDSVTIDGDIQGDAKIDAVNIVCRNINGNTKLSGLIIKA